MAWLARHPQLACCCALIPSARRAVLSVCRARCYNRGCLQIGGGLFNSAGNNVLAKPAAPVSGSLMCAAVEWIERKE
ncbi:hypothetical protein [Eikenella corrodens]|uniref:hypothetical protein n=1 Tax=Eikenella corrodens TaxID=539 RepID=UPI000B28AAED|nr:hypothetical protein [Eikenella corrodens]